MVEKIRVKEVPMTFAEGFQAKGQHLLKISLQITVKDARKHHSRLFEEIEVKANRRFNVLFMIT